MPEQYPIQKGDRRGDNTMLTVENDTRAYTEDFDIDIEWGYGDMDAWLYGVASIDGKERAYVDEDAGWWYATPIEEEESQDPLSSDVSPFIAVAHLAYIENW